jgi:di/tricarboxylate transporter
VTDATITFAVLFAAVALFIWNRLPVEIVAIGAAFCLYATGVVDLRQMLGGFGDPAVVFIATLFVVSEALDASGVTTRIGEELNARTGGSRTRLLVLIMLANALLTALISVNGAVAALLPVVVLMAVRRGPPSQLLMPLVFAAHAGSLLTLTGTPVNVLLSEAATDAGYPRFGYFEFGLVGVPLLLGTIVIVVTYGERLLPRRTARAIPSDLGALARNLMEQYALKDVPFRLRVAPNSPYIGRSPTELDLEGYPGITLLGAQSPSGEVAIDWAELAEGDVLVVRGDISAVTRLSTDKQLTIAGRPVDHSESTLFTGERGMAEVLVPPRSEVIGETVFPGMTTSTGDLLVMAIQRSGGDVRKPIELAAGDTLLLWGHWDALARRVDQRDLVVVDRPDLIRRRVVPIGPQAIKAVAVLLGMVILLATGAVPEATAGLLAAAALVLLRVITMAQAYRAISWTTVVLVAAVMPLSIAMQQSGAARILAEALVRSTATPYALLAGLFLLTAALGQWISNMATALVVSPIAVSAAAGLGISARPLLMTVGVAAAASFLTPVATPVNYIVKEPGGYAFGDYWKLGLPLLLWFFIVSIALIPIFWPF